jgi:hypothetical protein
MLVKGAAPNFGGGGMPQRNHNHFALALIVA